MTTIRKGGTPFFGGDRFEQITAVIMTLIVIQTAVITYWFTLADDANGDAGRDGQIFALEGLGKRTVGNIRLSYDQTSAFSSWLELDTLARLAEQRGDSITAAQLRAARDRLPRLSPLLGAPYFEPGTSTTPDIKQYEVDTFLRESIALAERFENQSRLKTQWADRSSSYTVMLTVLAVTLFLLGISGNSPRLIRRLLFGIGVALAIVVLAWMLVIYSDPVNSYSDEAMAAYAEGVSDAYQEDYAQAISHLDRAIELAPAYTNAYRDRGVSKFYSGDIAGAAADFESALENGETSSEVVSGLGYLYYLLGEYDAAEFLHRSAVEEKPDEMWIRANEALNLLGSGDRAGAETAYTEMLNDVARTVSEARAQGKQPPAALWYDFDQTAQDLDALAACGENRECELAPPFAVLSDPATIGAAARQLATRLREYSVALEYTGQPPPASIDAQVDPFRFTRVLSADDETVQNATSFAATDEPIYVSIPFRGLREGQRIVLKVYADDVEDERLRFNQEYSANVMGGADGDLLLPLTTGGLPFSPGAYRIEMYIDSKLVQRGAFEVLP